MLWGSNDFTTGTVSGVETLMGSDGDDTVAMTVMQWTGFDTIDLGSSSNSLYIVASGSLDISKLHSPTTISRVSTGSLTGTINKRG